MFEARMIITVIQVKLINNFPSLNNSLSNTDERTVVSQMLQDKSMIFTTKQ